MSLSDRIKNAWNAFRNGEREIERTGYVEIGNSYSYRPDRRLLYGNNERSIAQAIFNRISMDVAGLTYSHVRLDENGRYEDDMKSDLNERLRLSANLDQTADAFMQDVVLSMFDEGSVAIVPVDTTVDPLKGSYDIESMRTGKIVSWYPKHVRVSVYDEGTGTRREIVLPKATVAIVENPFYAIINEPNSVLKRLVRKLNLLDVIDEQSSSGRLDLIIQLPYTTHSELKRNQAEQRRKAIEDQLVNSKYGIAYADATEKIVQLNRPVENNLMKAIEYLTSMLYSQLGLTEEIFNGTADEKVMLNYYNRTIEPIISTIVDNLTRKFLTKTARSQHQAIKFFRDPFRLVPVNQLADIADRFTRNEILTSNEVRAIIGYKPVNTDRANELLNKNISQGNLMPENLAPGYSSGEEEMEGYPYGEDQV